MFTPRVRFFIGLLAIALYCSVAVVEAAPTRGSTPAPKNGATTPATGSKLASGPGKCKAKFKQTRGAGGWKTVTAKGPRGPKGKVSNKATQGNNSPPPNKSTPQGTTSSGKKKRSDIFDLVPRAPLTLYHITGETAANDIMQNGVQLNCVGDFSPQNMPGFYLASDRAKLIEWCKTGINRQCTRLVEFHYNKGAVTEFKFNKQGQATSAWTDSDDFCKYYEFATWCVHDSKGGTAFPAAEFTGDYAALRTADVIIGPMLDVYTFDQYAFRSAAALTALGAPVQVHTVS